MSNQFQSYRGGNNSVLPPGYLQAATQPGRSMAAGMMSAGQSIGDALTKMGEERKAKEQEEKSRARVHSGMETLVTELGIATKEQAKTQNSEQLGALLRKYTLEQEGLERQSNMDVNKAKLAGMKQQQQGSEVTQAALRDLASAVAAGIHPEAALSKVAGDFPQADIRELAKQLPAPVDEVSRLNAETAKLNAGTAKQRADLEAQRFQSAMKGPGEAPKISTDGAYYSPDGRDWRPVPAKDLGIDPTVFMLAGPEERQRLIDAALGGDAKSTTPRPAEPSEMWKKFEQRLGK